MSEIIRCPLDERPIGMLGGAGILETVCPSCSRRYRIVRGTLSGRRDGKKSRRGTEIELTVSLDDAQVTVSHRLRRDERLHVSAGESVTVAEQYVRHDRRRLLYVQAGDEIQHFSQPGDRAMIVGLGAAFRTFVLAMTAVVLGIHFGHWSAAFASPLAALLAFLWGWLRYRMGSSRQRVALQEQRVLVREQFLLEALDKHRLRIREITGERESFLERIARMRALRDKMAAIENTPYRDQIAVLDRGIEALEQHLANDARLLAAYERARQMVEVEYEASRLAAHLPDSTMDTLDAALLELQAIEEENVELELEIEAVGEVERMLVKA